MAKHGAEDTRHILHIFWEIGGRHNIGGSNQTTRTARIARISRIPRSGAAMGTDRPQNCSSSFFQREIFFFNSASWQLVDGTTTGGRIKQQRTTRTNRTPKKATLQRPPILLNRISKGEYLASLFPSFYLKLYMEGL